MDYAFDKHKLPKDLSFALKRSILDAALEAHNIKNVVFVYYWRNKFPGDYILRADFLGEEMKGWFARGKSSITHYAVPSADRKLIEAIIINEVLPRLCQWLSQSEAEGNVWRSGGHSIVFRLKDDQLVVEQK